MNSSSFYYLSAMFRAKGCRLEGFSRGLPKDARRYSERQPSSYRRFPTKLRNSCTETRSECYYKIPDDRAFKSCLPFSSEMRFGCCTQPYRATIPAHVHDRMHPQSVGQQQHFQFTCVGNKPLSPSHLAADRSQDLVAANWRVPPAPAGSLLRSRPGKGFGEVKSNKGHGATRKG